MALGEDALCLLSLGLLGSGVGHVGGMLGEGISMGYLWSGGFGSALAASMWAAVWINESGSRWWWMVSMGRSARRVTEDAMRE